MRNFWFLLVVLSLLVLFTEKTISVSTKLNNIQKAICRPLIAGLLTGVFVVDNMISVQNSVAAESINVSKTPQVFGLKKGRLLICKTTSNCISTSSITSLEKYSPPWAFNGDADDEFNKLVSIINSDKYIKLSEVDSVKYYIHAEAKSAVPPTSVDDIEFLINKIDNIITYRSNSRDLIMAGTQAVGDGGSNKNRLETIRRKLGVEEMRMSDEAEDYVKQTQNMGLLKQMQQASLPNEINFIDNSVPEK